MRSQQKLKNLLSRVSCLYRYLRTQTVSSKSKIMAHKKEERRYRRAKIKWPVVIMAPYGLIDGRAKNISLGGAFVSCSRQPNSDTDFRMVLIAEERFILVNAQVVWLDTRKTMFRGLGVRFTTFLVNDRPFISRIISNGA